VTRRQEGSPEKRTEVERDEPGLGRDHQPEKFSRASAKSGKNKSSDVLGKKQTPKEQTAAKIRRRGGRKTNIGCALGKRFRQ